MLGDYKQAHAKLHAIDTLYRTFIQFLFDVRLGFRYALNNGQPHTTHLPTSV